MTEVKRVEVAIAESAMMFCGTICVVVETIRPPPVTAGLGLVEVPMNRSEVVAPISPSMDR